MSYALSPGHHVFAEYNGTYELLGGLYTWVAVIKNKWMIATKK